MSCINRDLTLDEALADPVIGAAMRADRVNPHHFEFLLRTTAKRLGGGSPSRSPAASLAAGMRAGMARVATSGDLAAW